MKNILLVMCIFVATNAYAGNYYDIWSQKYDELLKKYVKEGEINNTQTHLIDYKGMKQDANYASLLSIGSIKGKRGRKYWKSFSQDKKLAFFINFHNFLAINYIVKNRVPESIDDMNLARKAISGALNRRVMSMASALVSIRTLSFKNPMVYFALSRGVITDPPLRKEAYTGDKLKSQLEDQLKKYFIFGTGKKILSDRKQILFSEIFKNVEFNQKPKEWLIDRGRLVFFAHDYDVAYAQITVNYVNRLD